MNLVFVTEARFVKDKAGNVFGDPSFTIDLWKRYLQTFSHVYIVGRVYEDFTYEGKMEMISSSSSEVTFVEIPYYLGLSQFIQQYFRVKKKIRETVTQHQKSFFICRVPGVLSDLVIKELSRIKKSYAVEVVGDPEDVFAVGGVKHPLRRILKLSGVHNLKRNVKNASAALYVTDKTLQRKYPALQAKFITNASNVKLEDDTIESNPRKKKSSPPYIIISVGSLAQMYKSPDIVLEAIKQVRDAGLDCRLIWLGDGRFMSDMKERASSMGLDDFVDFKGNVPKDEVKLYLATSDLFILASRTEGLPRAMIEAMAKGLPCVGTRVGGIPELLDENMLVNKDSVSELAVKIEELLCNTALYNQVAERNLKESLKYSESILNKRRLEFYQYIINHL